MIMSKDKYPSLVSRQMETIVFATIYDATSFPDPLPWRK